MSGIIFLFGPSCSGKSTLGQALQETLQETLQDEWTYLDRDNLIEQEHCAEHAADSILDNRIQSIGKRVIIDTQIPWRPKREGELYFLVLPSLETLLERDAIRTKNRNRSESQADRARKYVRETHSILSEINLDFFDHHFDSSKQSIQGELQIIRTYV